MLRIETHPATEGERLFSLDLPVANATEVPGTPGRVELLMPAGMMNAVAGIVASASEGVFEGKSPPEIVEMLTTRITTSFPQNIEFALRITALASALVQVWEAGIYGKSGFELGSTLTHTQNILIQLAEGGPKHYKTVPKRRGSVA